MVLPNSSILKGTLSMAFTGALVMGSFGAPALAAPKTKNPTPKASGKAAPKQSAPVMTEDTDTNDPVRNNIVDVGDNRHPSGKDRSVEHGRSVNQGKTKSDPDDSTPPNRSNGGVDQANRPGGLDKADQDGNNGCGNDDDFEDDSNGWCGGRVSTKPRNGPRDPGNGPSNGGNNGNGNGNGTSGSGSGSNTPAGNTPATTPVAVPTSVLGTTFTSVGDPGLAGTMSLDPASMVRSRTAGHNSHNSHNTHSHNSHNSHNSHGPKGTLPNTGVGSDGLTRLAIMLLGAGSAVVLTSRRRTASTSV